jgi:hypothetical protein
MLGSAQPTNLNNSSPTLSRSPAYNLPACTVQQSGHAGGSDGAVLTGTHLLAEALAMSLPDRIPCQARLETRTGIDLRRRQSATVRTALAGVPVVLAEKLADMADLR